MAKRVTSTTGKRALSPRYRKPLTGDKRKCRRPLWIDRLPQEVRDEIIAARDAGKTWKETAQTASAKAGRVIPLTTLQRWFDLRIDQPRRESPEMAGLLRAVRELTHLIQTDIERRTSQ